MVTDGQRRERRSCLRLFVPVPHVQVHQVIPMPSVNCEDNEDEEIRSERKSFSERHEDSKSRRSPHQEGPRTPVSSSVYVTVHSGKRQRNRPMTMSVAELRALLDSVASGEVDAGRRRASCRRRPPRPAVRRPRVCPRRSPSLDPAGFPRSCPRLRQNACPDCRHRRRNRGARVHAARDPGRPGRLRRGPPGAAGRDVSA